MGTTLLHLRADDDREGAAVLYFQGRKDGADNWREIVDDLELLGDRIATRATVAMERLDPHRRAGQGARYRLPIKLAALLAAHLEQRHREVVAAGDLLVVAAGIPADLLRAARRVAARREVAE